MSVDLSAYNNKWYKPGSSLKRFFWYWTNVVFFKTGLFPVYGLKTFLLRLFGAKVGQGVLIKPFTNIKYPWLLELGDHIWIGENVWIDNLAKVMIGNNVCISQGALLLTGNHDFSKRTFDLVVKPIVVEEGVWIGAKAVVCGGSVCRSHAVIAVGSVVNDEADAYGIYKGNPAMKIKQRKID
jgi:putative colanic acid biosynthesis acetyltransferase WcaF